MKTKISLYGLEYVDKHSKWCK